ncbi:hypothetical protein HYT24_01560 [Candidatus Pacearchaeota archaeon]|nr:hypothetical protein [Candidatus Pacearchaeota archaeon]
MIDLNDLIRKGTFGSRFLSLTQPQSYLCANVADFIENSNSVKPTTNLLPQLYYFDTKIKGAALILFSELDFRFAENHEKGSLSDNSGSLEVNLKPLNSRRRRNLRNNLRLYHPALIFRLHDRTLGLHFYFNYSENKMIGQVDEVAEKKGLGKLALA